MALLRQPDYHFTDFSPSGNVVTLNRKLKFTDLDTTTALMPNLPVPPSRGLHVSSEPDVLDTVLTGADRQIYLDHRATAAAHHVVITAGSESCYVLFRRDTRKHVRAFASVLHVGNPELFHHGAQHLGRHILTGHSVAATLMERRVVARRPAASVLLPHTRPKMFKSRTLSPDRIDYLYSELTCLAW